MWFEPLWFIRTPELMCAIYDASSIIDAFEIILYQVIIIVKIKMKFTLLVAAVAAQACDTTADCAEMQCCGTAIPESEGVEQNTCNDETSVTWADADFNSYTFACNIEDGAQSLVATASALVLAAVYMA